jgi:hypothetical protein
MAAEPTFVIAGPAWPDVQHLTACDVTGGKDLVVRCRKDYQMGKAADVMHRKIGAFNAHDAKETPAVFSPNRETEPSGAGLHSAGAEGNAAIVLRPG